MFRTLVVCAGLSFTSAVALAQATPPSPDATAPSKPKRQPTAKEKACRDTARSQGLKGKARSASVKTCVTEARNACREETKTLRGSQRREKMRACMNT